MNKKVALLLIVFAGLFATSGFAEDAKPMTNQDVISMVKAKVSESTITMAIRAAKPGFDTSAGGIVKLSTAGVPESIIQAMIEAKSGGGSTSAGGGSGVNPNAMNPEEVVLVQGDNRSTMKYLAPQMRTSVRGPFGGVGQYAALNGTMAALRLKNREPAFILAIPENAQPESYYTVASFAVRKNGTREVMVGGGYYSYSSGVNKDRVMPASTEKLPDQGKAPKGFILYKVTVTKPLQPGEYAFILYNSQVKVVGWFASGNDSYFDFGVDP